MGEFSTDQILTEISHNCARTSTRMSHSDINSSIFIKCSQINKIIERQIVDIIP